MQICSLVSTSFKVCMPLLRILIYDHNRSQVRTSLLTALAWCETATLWFWVNGPATRLPLTHIPKTYICLKHQIPKIKTLWALVGGKIIFLKMSFYYPTSHEQRREVVNFLFYYRYALFNVVFCWLGHLKMSFYYPTSHEYSREVVYFLFYYRYALFKWPHHLS